MVDEDPFYDDVGSLNRFFFLSFFLSFFLFHFLLLFFPQNSTTFFSPFSRQR